ncbi:hypothetical protein XENOCAPTIV_030020, partial [Xenoophorus captivus]
MPGTAWHEIYTFSPGFSRASESSLDAAGTATFPGHGPLSRGEPIPGRPALHKEKRTLPWAPTSFSRFICITALDSSRGLSPPLQRGRCFRVCSGRGQLHLKRGCMLCNGLQSKLSVLWDWN